MTGIDIRWGKELTKLSSTADSVQLAFHDGDSVDVDFVFGADGTSSTVRELLLGHDAARSQRSGLMFATGIINDGDVAKIKRIVDAHPVAAIMMGTDAVAGCGGKPALSP